MSIARIRVTGAATDTAVVAAVAGKQHKVLYFQFTVSAAATVTLSDGADGTTTRLVDGDFAANGGLVLGQTPNAVGNLVPHFIGTANTALNITNSAGNLKGILVYVTE